MIWNVLDYFSFYLLNTNKIRAAKSSFSVVGKELRFLYGAFTSTLTKINSFRLRKSTVFFSFSFRR